MRTRNAFDTGENRKVKERFFISWFPRICLFYLRKHHGIMKLSSKRIIMERTLPLITVFLKYTHGRTVLHTDRSLYSPQSKLV